MNGQVFADVFVTEQPVLRICYRTGLTVYEESLMRGQFVGRAWNAQGYIHPVDLLLDPVSHPAPQAFWLELDGQLLDSHWEIGEITQHRDADKLHVTVPLRHTIRPVAVRVHTLLDGTPVLSRWLEIENCGDRPAAISSACPWSGVIHTGSLSDRPFRASGDAPIYSVGYMVDTRAVNEGAFEWRPLPEAGYRIDGRYRRDRHRHPMFVLRNELTGEHFIGQLGWSGGYSFEFDLDGGPSTAVGSTRLFFRAGPDAPAPQRILAPGETATTPQMHMGLVVGDLDAAVQAMHDHARRSVMLPQPRGRGGWVEAGIGPEFEITPELVYHCIDVANRIGVEVFFVDASWYSDPHTNWWSTVGDWNVGGRFPDGLGPLRKYAHEKGMLFGLWMEAERLGPESTAFREPGDWLVSQRNGTRHGSALDLARPEVAQWVEDQICRVIADHELDFFRLDWNTTLGSGGVSAREGFIESNYWRYYEGLYGVFEHVRARFPDVILENCASGGGRTDFGMVRLFSHTWVTDMPYAPRSFSITNGMTMALPPEYVDRHVLGVGQPAHLAGDVDFQARLALFGRPTIGPMLWPLGAEPNPLLVARLKHAMDLYKAFVRPFQSTSRIYHHTPTATGRDPKGYGVIELASEDRSRAVAGIFALQDAGPECALRFRGLDPGREYRVTWDNTGSSRMMPGETLMGDGLRVRLTTFRSELVLCEAAP